MSLGYLLANAAYNVSPILFRAFIAKISGGMVGCENAPVVVTLPS